MECLNIPEESYDEFVNKIEKSGKEHLENVERFSLLINGYFRRQSRRIVHIGKDAINIIKDYCLPISRHSMSHISGTYLIGNIINNFMNSEENRCEHCSEDSGDDFNILNYIYIKGGALRDCYLLKDINDIDMVIDIHRLTKDFELHLKRYHSNFDNNFDYFSGRNNEDNVYQSKCILWRHYLNKFVSCSQTRDNVKKYHRCHKNGKKKNGKTNNNNSEKLCHFENYICNSNYVFNSKFIVNKILKCSKEIRGHSKIKTKYYGRHYEIELFKQIKFDMCDNYCGNAYSNSFEETLRIANMLNSNDNDNSKDSMDMVISKIDYYMAQNASNNNNGNDNNNNNSGNGSNNNNNNNKKSNTVPLFSSIEEIYELLENGDGSDYERFRTKKNIIERISVPKYPFHWNFSYYDFTVNTMHISLNKLLSLHQSKSKRETAMPSLLTPVMEANQLKIDNFYCDWFKYVRNSTFTSHKNTIKGGNNNDNGDDNNVIIKQNMVALKHLQNKQLVAPNAGIINRDTCVWYFWRFVKKCEKCIHNIEMTDSSNINGNNSNNSMPWMVDSNYFNQIKQHYQYWFNSEGSTRKLRINFVEKFLKYNIDLGDTNAINGDFTVLLNKYIKNYCNYIFDVQNYKLDYFEDKQNLKYHSLCIYNDFLFNYFNTTKNNPYLNRFNVFNFIQFEKCFKNKLRRNGAFNKIIRDFICAHRHNETKHLYQKMSIAYCWQHFKYATKSKKNRNNSNGNNNFVKKKCLEIISKMIKEVNKEILYKDRKMNGYTFQSQYVDYVCIYHSANTYHDTNYLTSRFMLRRNQNSHLKSGNFLTDYQDHHNKYVSNKASKHFKNRHNNNKAKILSKTNNKYKKKSYVRAKNDRKSNIKQNMKFNKRYLLDLQFN